MSRLFALSSAVVLFAGVSQALPGTPKDLKYVFSFGDSYTQTWFNASGILPNPSNPIGNPEWPGWTACAGPVTNWLDDITAKFNTSLVYTYNYAYGGATIDRDLVFPYTPTVQTMEEQVAIFLAGAGTKPPSTLWSSKNSLFSFFIGINDIGNSFWLDGDRDAFSDTLLNAYFALVEQTYTAGGRNFLFVNVPGVDRSPLMLGQPQASRDLEKSVIATYNKKLAQKVSVFKKSHPGIKTWLYDSNSRLVSILDNPTKYGLKDGTSFGPGLNDVAWCDNYHISHVVHEVYGKDVATILKHGGFF